MACCILEIAMLVYGIVTQVTGKFTITRTRAVFGWPARVLGVLLMLPLPINLLIGVAVGAGMAAQRKQVDMQAMQTIAWIEPVVTLVIFVITMVSGFVLSNNPHFSRPPAKRLPEDADDFERHPGQDDDDWEQDDEFRDRPQRRT